MRLLRYVFIAAMLLLLAGCAGPNNQVNVPVDGQVAGFWNGLLHGLILPFSWIGSLFDPTISIYEVHNNGGWYNFGFILGLGSLGGGSHAGRSGDEKKTGNS